MNKRGQIYLIVSLILGLVIFFLTSKPNTISITQSEDDFLEISQNYNQESSRFLRDLVKNSITDPGAVKQQFTSFSGVFTQYSKSQNPTFGLIYLLAYSNTVYIGNFFDKQIKVFDENWDINGIIVNGCFEKINSNIIYGPSGIGFSYPLSTFSDAGCAKDLAIPLNNNFILRIGDEKIDYEITILPDQPEAIVISRESVFEDRKVFLEHEFIKGKKGK